MGTSPIILIIAFRLDLKETANEVSDSLLGVQAVLRMGSFGHIANSITFRWYRDAHASGVDRRYISGLHAP
jgi:hypothetical protein